MMWDRKSWLTYLTVLVITVVVLIAGQLLWHQYAVAKPLDKGLQQVQGVEAANWEEGGRNSDAAVLDVTLGGVENLQKTYMAINDTARQALGRKAFRVVLRDHRSPELENLDYQIQYSVQEAMVSGNFTAMAAAVQKAAEGAKTAAKIYVDNQYVYIQLTKDRDALYTVVPRHGSEEVK
ncbi:MAG: hypothetical protein P4N59_26220 [Negativicutes bacterium]|nr:hypothetical protein [Negativicutes bacterium]